MMKLRILNMKEFLKTVNGCEGPVYLVDSDGRRENVNKEYGTQVRISEKPEYSGAVSCGSSPQGLLKHRELLCGRLLNAG